MTLEGASVSKWLERAGLARAEIGARNTPAAVEFYAVGVQGHPFGAFLRPRHIWENLYSLSI